MTPRELVVLSLYVVYLVPRTVQKIEEVEYLFIRPHLIFLAVHSYLFVVWLYLTDVPTLPYLLFNLLLMVVVVYQSPSWIWLRRCQALPAIGSWKSWHHFWSRAKNQRRPCKHGEKSHLYIVGQSPQFFLSLYLHVLACLFPLNFFVRPCVDRFSRRYRIYFCKCTRDRIYIDFNHGWKPHVDYDEGALLRVKFVWQNCVGQLEQLFY